MSFQIPDNLKGLVDNYNPDQKPGQFSRNRWQFLTIKPVGRVFRIIPIFPPEEWVTIKQHWIPSVKRSVVCLGPQCPVCNSGGGSPKKRIFIPVFYDNNGQWDVRMFATSATVANMLSTQFKNIQSRNLDPMRRIYEVQKMDSRTTIVNAALEELSEQAIKALHEKFADKIAELDITDYIGPSTVEAINQVLAGNSRGNQPKPATVDTNEQLQALIQQLQNQN